MVVSFPLSVGWQISSLCVDASFYEKNSFNRSSSVLLIFSKLETVVLVPNWPFSVTKTKWYVHKHAGCD